MTMLGDDYFRSSRQTRPVLPEGDPGGVPARCTEMAEAMREGHTTFKALRAEGFTVAEITEYHAFAAALATERSTRQISLRPDELADIIDKARVAMPNRPPLPRGMGETQATFTAWNRYCQARAALTLDPWPTQRERCLAILRSYLDRSALFAPVKAEIVNAVAASYPMVVQ